MAHICLSLLLSLLLVDGFIFFLLSFRFHIFAYTHFHFKWANLEKKGIKKKERIFRWKQYSILKYYHCWQYSAHAAILLRSCIRVLFSGNKNPKTQKTYLRLIVASKNGFICCLRPTEQLYLTSLPRSLCVPIYLAVCFCCYD